VSEHAILIEGIEKYFSPAYSGWRSLLQPFARPTLRALVGVTLSVEPGEVMALVGANGAGKSTLLRIVATLIIPTSGHVFVEGFDVERERNHVLRKIGYHTGGDEGFYGRLTGSENLEFFAAMNNCVGADAARRIEQVAELMGIAETLDRQVRTFSTGMMHRLGLARAFLHAPPVLLLDEPTRSLDPLAAAEFRRFLRNDLVRQHGTTLLFASHTLSEVEELADRVAILDAGRLLACDTTRGLRAATGTATLEQAFERLSQRAEKVAPAEAFL